MQRTKIKRIAERNFTYKDQPVTRGERNILWIQEYCRVPEGSLVGQPVVLAEFQKELLKDIYDNTTPTRTAIISFGRKNGKTALAAFLLLLHLCGPESRPNSSLYSSAMSKDQAALTFDLAAKCIRLSPKLDAVCRVVQGAIRCEKRGTVYRARSAEHKTALGLSPVFTIHDELGQVKGSKSELYEALESGSAAHEQPLSIIISTQAPTDGDLLSILIDDALSGSDPSKVVRLYTANTDMDAFTDDALKAANPAWDAFQNQNELRQQQSDAKRMPSKEATFRNLNLNQRITVHSPFINPSALKSNHGKAGDWRGRNVIGGLDLSETTDLTSLVLLAENEDLTYDVFPQFWLPEEGLSDRARNDRVPYDVWAKKGLLQTCPGASVNYKWVAQQIYDISQEAEIQHIAFDRWNFRHFKPALADVGIPDHIVESLFIPHGQGFKDMSPSLRIAEELFLNKQFRTGGHPILDMCLQNAKVSRDPSGNRKLDKSKSNGRIDGAVALLMACSLITPPEKPARKSYLETSRLLVL